MKYNFIEFKTAFREGNLKVGDKLITTDLCGDAIFEVADIHKKEIFMVRKYVLPDHDKTYDYLIDFLNGEYLASLPVEITTAIEQRDNNCIFVPREVEVFGKHIFSDPKEKGRQWKIFEKTKGRIRCEGDAYGDVSFWWLCSPNISNSTGFCNVNASGAPSGNYASYLYGVLPCFIINPKALTENDMPENPPCIACKYEDDDEAERCERCLAGDSQFEPDDALADEFVEPTERIDVLKFIADNAGLSLPEAIELAYVKGYNNAKLSKPTTKNNLAVDCIAREAVEDAIYDASRSLDLNYDQIIGYIDNLPSVTPQEWKKGEWIEEPNCSYRCSNCEEHYFSIQDHIRYKFCPNCGADMRAESEE